MPIFDRRNKMDFKKLAGKNWKGIMGIDYYSDGEEYMVLSLIHI